VDDAGFWDAARYDSQCSYVWKYGKDLVELLAPKRGERILDLGCGTGHLSRQIADAGAEVIGIDNSPAMITQARANYADLRFEIGDGKDFAFPKLFDAVFSNATLHWIKEAEQLVRCVRRALRPGGRFVAEFGGKGNIQAILAAIDHAMETVGHPRQEPYPWYYPSLGEYATLLERHGFQVTYATLFDRPTPLDGGEHGLSNSIEVFAKGLFIGIPVEQCGEVMQAIEEQLRPTLYRNGTWVADYKRLRVVAMREDVTS